LQKNTSAEDGRFPAVAKHLIRPVAAVAASLLATAAALAGSLQVVVVDAGGKPMRDVVVVALPAANIPAPTPTVALMDQVDKQFVPEVLAIRVGTTVTFPNNDSIAHQVYSFSPAKRFELPLYRGRAHPPVVFDQPGIVVLGCNIHDHMAAYIYVTPSPYFSKTDAHGQVVLNGLPAGSYKVSAWSPYFSENLADQEVTLGAQQSLALRFALKRGLRPQRPPIDPRIRDY
jgi:plastocyanin